MLLQSHLERRAWFLRYALPASVLLLVMGLAMPVLMNLSTSEPQQVAILATALLGLVLATAWAAWGAARKQAVAEPVSADALLDGLVAKLGPEVGEEARRCRQEALSLRSEAAQARAALQGLPADGEGARALAEAAEQAETRATHIDDQLAALYAQSLAGAVAATDALDRLGALEEVEGTERQQKARMATQARARNPDVPSSGGNRG